MITRPSAERLYKKVDSLYTLAILSARRARQINVGGELLLPKYKSDKPVSRSLEEIAADKLKYRKNKTDSIK